MWLFFWQKNFENQFSSSRNYLANHKLYLFVIYLYGSKINQYVNKYIKKVPIYFDTLDSLYILCAKSHVKPGKAAVP